MKLNQKKKWELSPNSGIKVYIDLKMLTVLFHGKSTNTPAEQLRTKL